MNYEDTTPKARHWALPLMAAVTLASVAWLQVQDEAWGTTLLLLAAVFGGWALVNFAKDVGAAVNSMRNESKRLDFYFSENYKIEKIAQMSPEQLKTLRAGHHVIDVYPSEDGITVDKVGGEEVFLRTAWYMLVNSTNGNVFPINRFQPGTYHFDEFGDQAVDDRQQARNFTIWLVRYGYAQWSRGSESASWKRPFGPDEVLRRLGMDRATYLAQAQEVPQESMEPRMGTIPELG